MPKVSSHVDSLPGPEELRAWVEPKSVPRVSLYLPLEQHARHHQQNLQMRDQALRDIEKKLAALGIAAALVGAAARDRDRCSQPGTAHRDARRVRRREAQRSVPLHAALPYAASVGNTFALRPLLGVLARSSRYRLLAVSEHRVALFDGGKPVSPRRRTPASGESRRRARIGDDGEGTARARHGRRRRFAVFVFARQRQRGAQARSRALPHRIGRCARPRARQRRDPARDGGHRRTPHRVAREVEAAVAAGRRQFAATWTRWDRPNSTNAPGHSCEQWCSARAAASAAHYERARNHGKGLDLVDDVAAAAVAGRVRRLWLDAERRIAGRIDRTTGRTLDGAGDDDVLDALAELVLARGGEVIPVPAAALPSRVGARRGAPLSTRNGRFQHGDSGQVVHERRSGLDHVRTPPRSRRSSACSIAASDTSRCSTASAASSACSRSTTCARRFPTRRRSTSRWRRSSARWRASGRSARS